MKPTTIGEIRNKFTGKLLGNKRMQKLVCETLLIFPSNIINFVTKNVWFVSSFDDAWGYTLRMDELWKGKLLVFLSDELFEQNEYDQKYEVAHEIGHVMLGHKNSILEKQTKAEIDKQEKEAHEFAEKFLS